MNLDSSLKVFLDGISDYTDLFECIYLYGSCSKGTDFNYKHSDIDIMCVMSESDFEDKRALRKLRIDITPEDYTTMEFDIHFCTQELLESDDIFYKNVVKDGRLLWHKTIT